MVLTIPIRSDFDRNRVVEIDAETCEQRAIYYPPMGDAYDFYGIDTTGDGRLIGVLVAGYTPADETYYDFGLPPYETRTELFPSQPGMDVFDLAIGAQFPAQ